MMSKIQPDWILIFLPCLVCNVIYIVKGQAITGSYNISFEVVPAGPQSEDLHLHRKQPCPSDIVLFTCTRSESSVATLLWVVGGNPSNRLYNFEIPVDIGTPNASKTFLPGFTGVLVNETTSLLYADLRIPSANNIINKNSMYCGQIGGPISYPSEPVLIKGAAARPYIDVECTSKMSVILRLIVPLNGTECVDAYKVTVIINEWTLFNEMKVTNHTQNRYMFEFPLDACDYASLSNVTAVAMTGGIEGSRAMLSVIDSMCCMSSNATGISLWQSIVITATLTAIIVFAVGVVGAHLITRCYVKQHHALLFQQTTVNTTSGGVNISKRNSSGENYDVEENAAYGKFDFQQ